MNIYHETSAPQYPELSRRGFFAAGLVTAAGVLLTSGCDALDEGQRAATSETEQSIEAPQAHPETSPVDIYVPNWLKGKKYDAASENVKPGDIRRAHLAFAIFDHNGEVTFEEPSPGLRNYIANLGDETKLSVAVGGAGNSEARKSDLSSPESLRIGWDKAMLSPAAFSRSAGELTDRLAQLFGRQVDLDIDCEFPLVNDDTDDRTRFANLAMQVKYDRPNTHVSMAVPSRDNLEGFRFGRLTENIDSFGVMTYAGGENYGPEAVVADITDIARKIPAEKIVVGYSTQKGEDPRIWTPRDMQAIREGLAKAAADPALAKLNLSKLDGSMVWTGTDLTQDHLAALRS